MTDKLLAKLGITPGPWPITDTGDYKRIIIGKGLVEGPNGYEVAEVYSDDCPHEIAEANARVVATAPEMFLWIYGMVKCAKSNDMVKAAKLLDLAPEIIEKITEVSWEELTELLDEQ